MMVTERDMDVLFLFFSVADFDAICFVNVNFDCDTKLCIISDDIQSNSLQNTQNEGVNHWKQEKQSPTNNSNIPVSSNEQKQHNRRV